MNSKLLPTCCLRFAIWAAVSVFSSPGFAEETWDAGDTRLANHYIYSLKQKPEYGKVLDLLWNHYEKHDQTRLLLQYFDQAAQRDNATDAKLINGHLLRKKGNPEAALEAYMAVDAESPGNIHVIRAMAEVNRQLGNHEAALAQFTQLIEISGTDADDWVDTEMARSQLLRKLSRSGEAIENWLRILESQPEDLNLRKRIVALLLEEGQTQAAIASYSPLLQSREVETRILAMKEVGRLHEFGDDFENAVAIYEQALETVHFKHYLHDEFLVRMVRVHERFSRADELEEAWIEIAEQENPTEAALWHMVRFYQIAANPELEETWLRRLVERVPGNTEYRQKLAARLVENDHYQEAEGILDDLVSSLSPTPLTILLLQARVHLTTRGVTAAEKLLADYLDSNRPTEEDLKRMLRFSQTNYLDAIAERLLTDQHQNGWGEEGRTPELQLASFHHERGRLERVRELLDQFAAGATNDREKSDRLLQVAEAFRDLRMPEASQKAALQAIESGLAKRGHYQLYAESLVEAGKIHEAIEEFERVWDMSETIEERIEIDQRIFTILRANSDETRLEKPAKINDGEAMASVWRFFHQLRQQIDEDPSPENRFRLAWWSVKTADYADAWKQLPLLHDPVNPVLEYEELLLDLGERTNNKQLIVRQLNLIAKIDPSREEEARIREAQGMLEQKLEDRAIRMLRNLVESPDSSLKAVQALAKAYREQERLNALNELWEATFREANVLEKRQIVKPYANTLIELERVPEALELIGKMIESETDFAQRRKLFEDQLSTASMHYLTDEWMLPRYEQLAAENPLDRFFPEAIARIHLAENRIDEALVSMKRAYYMADEDPQLLKELGELASRSSDLKAAIYYQRQLIAADAGQTSPDEWLALIDKLERDLRVKEADMTRRRLESKFGQDPDFLKHLSRHYLNAGDQVSARRVLAKIAAIRPWDAESVLELGLLRLETGDIDQAKAAFHQVLAETAQFAPNPDAPVDLIPFVPAKQTRTIPGQRGQLNLEEMAIVIDEYDFLPSENVEKLAEWMRIPKPEFLRNPTATRELRLRAIEELARLGETAATVGPTEALWQAHHQGKSEETMALIETHIRTKTEVAGTRWDLLYPLIALQNQGSENLKTWVESRPVRKANLSLAIYLLLGEPSFTFDDDELDQALSLVELPLQQARTFVHQLRIDRKFKEALQLGESAVRTKGIANYMFNVDLAVICEQAGYEAGRKRWLEQAFRDLTLGSQVPYYAFYTTVSEMYRMQTNADGQQRVINNVQQQIQRIPDSIEDLRTKAQMWLALATDRPEEAMRLVGVVAQNTTQRRKQFTGERDRDKGIETWVELEKMLNLAGQRIPRSQLASLAKSIVDFDFIQPTQEHSAAQFQQFRMIQLLWQLETANPPRRRQLIEEYLANVTNEDEPIELARSLEVRGFGPDTLPIYRQQVRDYPTENRMVSSYLGACRQAQAYEEAIDFLDQIYEQGVARPEAMTDESIHQNYANLFYLSGDVEELERRVEEGIGTSGGSSHYRRHLAQYYEKQGDLDTAIRLTLAGADERPLGFSDTLMLSDLMVENGDLTGAIALLEKLRIASKSANRNHVDQRLVRWYAKADPDNIERLAKLIANPSRTWPASTISAVATSLAEAGKLKDADAVLTLKARKSNTPTARFELLLQRAELRLTNTEELETSPADLQQLLAAWPGKSESGDRLLALVRETTPIAAESWKAATDALREARDGRVPAWAVQLFLPEAPDTPPALSSMSPGHLRFAAKAASLAEKPALAWKLLRELHTRFEEHPLVDGRLIFQVLNQLDDDATILEWYQRAQTWNESTAEFANLADVLNEIGRHDLAAALFKHRYERLQILTTSDQLFLTRYASFLIERKAFRDAERVLMGLFHKTIGGDPHLLVDLYGAWDRLDKIEGNLRKFFLNPHLHDEVLESAKAYPDHRPEIEEKIQELPPRPGLRRAA